jgi:hypothetical protein
MENGYGVKREIAVQTEVVLLSPPQFTFSLLRFTSHAVLFTFHFSLFAFGASSGTSTAESRV